MTITKIIKTLIDLVYEYGLHPSRVDVCIKDCSSDTNYEILGLEFTNFIHPAKKNKIIIIGKTK